MSDLTDELRRWAKQEAIPPGALGRAADEIDRLRAENSTLQVRAFGGEVASRRLGGLVDELRGLLLEARGEVEDFDLCCRIDAALGTAVQPNAVGPLTLDTDRQVFFYEQDFYVLSNFSSFALDLGGHMYPTSEHAYHAHKFPGDSLKQAAIRCAKSAHDAFKLAERWKQYRMGAWEQVRVDIMRGILRAKAAQHEYVRRKLLATGDRELIENSWRDDFWGWGPNRDGQNMLGQLWMEIRAEQRAADNSSPTE